MLKLQSPSSVREEEMAEFCGKISYSKGKSNLLHAVNKLMRLNCCSVTYLVWNETVHELLVILCNIHKEPLFFLHYDNAQVN